MTVFAVSVIVGIGPAQAKKPGYAPRSDTKTFDASTHYTEPVGSEAGVKCLGGETPEPGCRVLFGGHASHTGRLWGEGDSELEAGDPAGLAEGKLTYEGTDVITGGVKGCGEGTYLLEFRQGYFDVTKYDPITDSVPGYATWELRPGSGTGELTNLVSGSGEVRQTAHLKGLSADITPSFTEGDFTGTITCRV